MFNKFSFNSESNENPFEILLSLVLIRFVILALVLIFVMPKQEVKKLVENRDRGLIRIEIIWEQGKDVDVDLWVQAPGDSPVGWSNKNGKIFDLVRDDLGALNNPSGIHYEIAYARNVPSGEYVVNVHLYANREANYNRIPVKCIITMSKEDSDKSVKENVYERSIEFNKVGDEITVVRFTLDGNKAIIPNSISTIQRNIYKN